MESEGQEVGSSRLEVRCQKWGKQLGFQADSGVKPSPPYRLPMRPRTQASLALEDRDERTNPPSYCTYLCTSPCEKSNGAFQ